MIGSLLHPLFSSNAVLQRGREVPIWGEATPNTEVEILLDDQKFTAVADETGHWSASIGPQAAGLGHRLTVSTADETQARENIAFGDVWLCSGQSNMEWQLFTGEPITVVNAVTEAKNANFPAIRLLTVPHVSATTPQKSLEAEWKVCDPETVKGISAVGYFFGREIHQNTGVPIGLIDSAWGGTAAQVWASAEALAVMPEFTEGIEALKNTRPDVPFAVQQEEYLRTADAGFSQKWHTVDFDDSEWQTASQSEIGDFKGVIWFRYEITLNETQVNSGDVLLKVGPIVDADSVYWNEEKVADNNRWLNPREYPISANKLRVGKNIVAVRAIINGVNDFVGATDSIQLLDSEGNPIELSGEWKLKTTTVLSELPLAPVDLDAFPITPSILFNSMISPLLPYGIKGAIWYQGESNADKPEQYKTLLPIMIADWRARFDSGDFPFYIVQLAGYMASDVEAGQSVNGWPQIRESQEIISQTVKNSGLAVTIDIGDEVDIHPRNKQDVGKRLALLALKNDYEQNVVANGPLLKSVQNQGANLVIELSNTGGELITKGELNKTFIIAGNDQKWSWGEVVSVENGQDSAVVTLHSSEVAEPIAVRCGWANFPLGHIYNVAGLPAAPFRSDEC